MLQYTTHVWNLGFLCFLFCFTLLNISVIEKSTENKEQMPGWSLVLIPYGFPLYKNATIYSPFTSHWQWTCLLENFSKTHIERWNCWVTEWHLHISVILSRVVPFFLVLSSEVFLFANTRSQAFEYFLSLWVWNSIHTFNLYFSDC